MKRSAKTGLLEIGGMFGDYCVVRLLGKGSMGEVYLLRDKDGNQYAAKIMCPPDDSGNDGWITRFTREARFAMTVQHKNLVAVHKVGKDEATGFCYIIMDYVPGGTLSKRLEKNGRFSIREAVDITVQIASVLEVAHSVGVVHRDIKPDNILFDSDGSVKLSDLGVAKFRDTGTVMVTTAEMIIGTPAYMAPEQMLNSHNVDARADIYSLGLVLYEMLSGTRPHANSTVVELLTKAIKNEELPDIRTLRPEISIALSQVIAMMVATKPEERVATAMDVVKMLYEANSDRLILRKSSCPAGKSSAVRHRWWVRGGIVAGIAACAVVAWLVFLQMHKETSPSDRAENSGNGQQNEDGRDVFSDQRGLNVAAMDISEFLVEGSVLKGFAKSATNEVVVIPPGAGIKTVCIDGLTSNMRMKVLVLPEGVERIGRVSGGYRPGTSLETVRLPASLTAIRPTGFDANWRHLNSIEVAQGSPYRMQDFCLIDTRDSSVVFALPGKDRIVVPPGIKRIADWAFDYNDVREVVISEGVEEIGRGAFKGCRSMTKLSIPASVDKIGKEFLSGCGRLNDVMVAEANPYYCTRDVFLIDKLTKTLVRAFGTPRKVDVPADIRVIGAGAFSFMDSIVSLTVPDTVERIEEDAFDYCKNLLELRLPNRLEYCSSHLISGCASLKSMKFPVGLSHLAGNYAIGGCGSLKEIILPEGLLTIGAGGLGAICECKRLERIFIPASVTTIVSGSSFMDNPSLTCFEVSPDNPKFCAYEGVLFDKDMTRLIRCPDAKKGVFCVPASVKSIDYCAFSGCNNLSEIQLPEGIGVVNKWAFRGCSAKTNFVSSASQKTFEKVNARRAEVQE